MMMLFHPSSRLKRPVIRQSVQYVWSVLEQRGRALAHPSSLWGLLSPLVAECMHFSIAYTCHRALWSTSRAG